MVYSFFLRYGFIPLGFPGKIFNETSYIIDSQEGVLWNDGCQPYCALL